MTTDFEKANKRNQKAIEEMFRQLKNLGFHQDASGNFHAPADVRVVITPNFQDLLGFNVDIILNTGSIISIDTRQQDIYIKPYLNMEPPHKLKDR